VNGAKIYLGYGIPDAQRMLTRKAEQDIGAKVGERVGNRPSTGVFQAVIHHSVALGATPPDPGVLDANFI
jgi:hypothetical protein